MAYIAMRMIRVNGEIRMPGDEVPEAETWRNIRPWIDAGHISLVPREMVPNPAKKSVPPSQDRPAVAAQPDGPPPEEAAAPAEEDVAASAPAARAGGRTAKATPADDQMPEALRPRTSRRRMP